MKRLNEDRMTEKVCMLKVEGTRKRGNQGGDERIELKVHWVSGA